MPAAASTLPSSLVLVGAGKMGGAMLEGWLSVGLAPGALTVVDPQPSEAIAALCRARGVTLNPESATADRPAVVVLAIKPQMLEAASPGIAQLVGPGTLVVSILAGKTIADLRARIPDARTVVRAMPNLPASIGRGATGAFANGETSAEQRAVAQTLLASIGAVEWVDDEGLIDAVTALSGSGPAYVFHMVECLARAGAAAGLPRDLAERLARATVAGAGALLADSPLPASTLRENVTSPGGTTAAALEVLMAADGLDPLMRKAVAAAKRRAEELAG
jgi:pyrroline-5-carboxylate reductase